MEENKLITTTTKARITLKRTSIKKRVNWEIASSSSEDKEELKEIVKMLKEIDGDMEREFMPKKIKTNKPEEKVVSK